MVVGLLSDVVLTFVPPSPVGPHGGAGPPPPRRRTDAASIAARSWTDGDLDVLLKRRGAVLFTGDARTAWHHAIRAGVVVGGDDAFDGCGDPTPPLQQAAAAPAVVCDWWGSMGVLLRRAPERVSVVLAFG